MTPSVYFIFVVFGLVMARKLEVFNEQTKVGPVIRHNFESRSSRYDLPTETESVKMMKMFGEQLNELKSLIFQQGKVLAQLTKGQHKMIKERDRNRRRHRYVKKYLRKIYLGCKCEARWFDPRNFHFGDAAGRKTDVVANYSRNTSAAVGVTDAGVNPTEQTHVLPSTQRNDEKTRNDITRSGVDHGAGKEQQTKNAITRIGVDHGAGKEQQTKNAITRIGVDDGAGKEQQTKNAITHHGVGHGNDGDVDGQTTPTLTILNRPYVHVDRFVAEAAGRKGASYNIPVVRKPTKYGKSREHHKQPENGILRDESKADDVSEMTTVGLDYLTTEMVALPTGPGRKWPEIARYVMGPYKGEYDVQIDLALGRVTGSHSSIKILEFPMQGIASYCIQQGVVKLSFGKPGTAHRHDALLIDMTFDTPSEWVFNIGDSSSNDGRSGDRSTQENDSEIDGFGTTFAVYGSDKSRDPWRKQLYRNEEFVKGRLSIVITDQVIVWNNFAGNFDFVRDPSLFALIGQSDDQGSVNFDIFLGLNRVIGGKYRNGRGLCTAALKWL